MKTLTHLQSIALAAIMILSTGVVTAGGIGDSSERSRKAKIEKTDVISATSTDLRGELEYTAVWARGFAGLALPPAITPNGDGENDFLKISNIDQYPDNVLLVFDDQGRKVYQQRGYNNGWAGVDNKGNELPSGTYFAIIEVGGMADDVQAYVALNR